MAAQESIPARFLSNPAVSAADPDWSREVPSGWWDRSRRLLRAFRAYQHWKARRGPLAACLRRVAVLRYRFWSVVTGAEIDLKCQIGGGLMIPHPNGIVLHPDAILGPNCLLFQQVTLGTGGPLPGAPRLGGHVDVGAGAKILGGVTIGNHARIGANAVVLTNVPPYATAVGIPAKILPSTRPGIAEQLATETLSTDPLATDPQPTPAQE